VIAQPNFTVDVKAGPAWRKTSYIGEPAASDLTGLAALNARWAISRTLTLTEDANALYSRDNTNLNSLTSLSAKLSNALSARVSYQITNNSNPPAGFKKTDTVTRFTMVYGF
jgi:putative salt-induced outer membrane protein